VFFRGWRAESFLGAVLCMFHFGILRAWIVNITLLKIPLSCFYQTVFLVYILFLFSCLDVISLIYGFSRRWRICCHLAHLHGSTYVFCFSFLSRSCKPYDLWIPEAMKDLLSSCPCFMVQQTFSFSVSFLDRVNSLISRFLRRWRICCHLAHLLWFIIQTPFVFLLLITT
jgi:hypothetical protein